MKIKMIGMLNRAAAVALLLTLTAAVQAQTYVNSSLNRYQAYAQPLYDSWGNKVGITVHYSIGALFSAPGSPSHYSAVCIKVGTSSGNPCIDRASSVRVWTSTSGSIGSWRSRNIMMNCNSTTNAVVQFHQPYIGPPGSVLNFYRSDSPAYWNGQLFYSGSSDSAKLQIAGCEQQ
ncbi:hypothetical protein FKG94_13025 [Exilibacterium tricleocarpae]|uniref:Uncharacterized protein n=1 Tax=Exilibacterium tricleocarpae TaxID=2591008 RepID=A0A545TNY0_9GAMM|nr:hypothetical protein [Exilibacterium tricleocarpae]TQV78929.1 hypothetical protein FKG94_13025 [Exilibacterium tricleocarpae]